MKTTISTQKRRSSPVTWDAVFTSLRASTSLVLTVDWRDTSLARTSSIVVYYSIGYWLLGALVAGGIDCWGNWWVGALVQMGIG